VLLRGNALNRLPVLRYSATPLKRNETIVAISTSHDSELERIREGVDNHFPAHSSRENSSPGNKAVLRQWNIPGKEASRVSVSTRSFVVVCFT